METSRKVILLQMTSLIMSRMMTQSEMMASHGHSMLNNGITSETRRSRDISHHVGQDGRVRGFGLRRGRDKSLGAGGGQRPRLEVPEGFDLSTAEKQEDGQFCVYKKLSLEGIEKVPVQQCIHKVDTQCYFSYITDYTPTTEEVCSENYSKRCFIELSKKSVQETSEKCYYPTERVCNPPREGEPPREVCQTQYETTCVTRYKETPVVEPVQECREECEEPLGGYRPRQGRDKELGRGECSQVCDTVRKTIIRPLPDTVCEKIPFEACAPDNCAFVSGQPQCLNTTQDVTVDSPEEVCDLQPQKMCKQVYRLVPRLTPKEICEEIPREVCFTTLQNPRKVSTPLLTKWCFSPEENETEDIDTGPAAPPQPSYSSPSSFPPPFPPQPLPPLAPDVPSPPLFPLPPPDDGDLGQYFTPFSVRDQFPPPGPLSLLSQDQFLDEPGFPPAPSLPSEALFPPPQYVGPEETFRSRP